MKIVKIIIVLVQFSHPFLLVAHPFQEKAFEQELWSQLRVDNALTKDWMQLLNDKLAEFQYPSLLTHSDTNALFLAYPTLQTKIPYSSLGALPTPIEKLERLSERYATNIYIKQDSLSGGVDELGAPVYGGNKVRKLEFLLAHARSLGATKVLTFGCVGSNHAVATTVHARQLGMEPICMLKHQPPSSVVQHNLLMHLHYGSELHYSPNNEIRALNTCTVWLDHYKKDGNVPYIIPTGGSNKYGTIGFVNAIFELVEQIRQGAMPKPTHIYVPCGSCATTAGILLGCKVTGLDVQVVAVAVEPGDHAAQIIHRLLIETNEYLHTLDATFPLVSYTERDLRIEKGFTGPEYGIFTSEGLQAADELAQTEQISIEGTYTAKACACLLHDVRKQPDMVALFWNTYSGLDFSQKTKSQDYTKLAQCFHDYFDNNNLQPLIAP